MATLKAEALADLVVLAVRAYDDTRRYSLQRSSSWVYADAAAGEAWDAERAALEEKYQKKAQELMEASKAQATAENKVYPYVHYTRLLGYNQEWEALRDRKPKQFVKDTYYLNSRRYSSIELGQALGVEVEKVWTHKKSRGGSQVITGLLTLKGLLKRLGAAGFEDQVKAARGKEQAKINRVQRNNARAGMRQAIETYHGVWNKLVERGVILVETTDETGNVLVRNERQDGGYGIYLPASVEAPKLPDSLTLEQVLRLIGMDEENDEETSNE